MSKKCLYNFSNNINESNYANIDNSYQIFKYDEKKVPFLLWNDHKNKYFENIPNINQDNYYTNI